jgi:hypothetical protein
VKGCRKAKVCALRSGDWHAADPESQAKLLREVFFPPQPSQSCSTSTAFDPAQAPTCTWKPFTGKELYHALKDTSNTSAARGLGLGYKLIKWITGGVERAEEAILHITNMCFDLGYVLVCWKHKLLAVVPKPQKTDMSTPKSYWPILLIECLSKLSKKMLVTCMQIDIICKNLLPNNQFGGLHQVGVNDAGLALRHNIEEAWARGEYCAIIAADIKQFFLLLGHVWLIHLLGLYSYPPQVTRWVLLFLEGRTYTFRIGSIVTQRRPFHRLGVLQWLPLLLVLAATYIAAACHSFLEAPEPL